MSNLVVFSLARGHLFKPGVYTREGDFSNGATIAQVDWPCDLVTVRRVESEDDPGEVHSSFLEMIDDVLEYAVKEPSNRFVCEVFFHPYTDSEGTPDCDCSFDLKAIGSYVDPLIPHPGYKFP